MNRGAHYKVLAALDTENGKMIRYAELANPQLCRPT